MLTTPYHALHKSLGARMAEFAGYDMPIQYSRGIMAEHTHTRSHASLFDVSHMGQCLLHGTHAAELLEALTPSDMQGLGIGRMRYTCLLNDNGGVIDDVMVLKEARDRFVLVVNASRKATDYALLKSHLGSGISLSLQHDRALVALQGPLAEAALQRLDVPVSDMPFMSGRNALWEGHELLITRSGYTGEDGFEISLPEAAALPFTEALTEDELVQWAGLGARDSLRLEAGLCLYGHELDETVSPIEAGLGWIIQKRRREEGGFAGAERIMREIKEGPARMRVGIKPEGRAIAREATSIFTPSNSEASSQIGIVTSGGFGPSVGGPLAMGYVNSPHAVPETPILLKVRDSLLPARIVSLPFHPHRYKGK